MNANFESREGSKDQMGSVPTKRDKSKRRSPYCFVSYSSREPEVALLIEAIEIVFSPPYKIQRTPSALESGASQLLQIENLIKNCTFAIVVLDGLRPNVVFEYGLSKGYNREIILLKEPSARVDVLGFWADRITLEASIPQIDVDKHFSDVKDQAYAKWNRLSFKETVATLWDEYEKKKSKIPGALNLKKPEIGT
jgi:hypothetical protein